MTLDAMSSAWANPSWMAPTPAPQVASGPPMDLKAMLAEAMAGQRYANAIQGAQRGAQGVTGNSQINSFGQFANMMNPAFSPQQRLNIAKAGATNRTSMGGSRSSGGRNG